MCIYGIELLDDNIAECRAKLLPIFAQYLKLDAADETYLAASYAARSQNLVHGDAMTMRFSTGQPISLLNGGYLGKGKFQRRISRLDFLTLSSGLQCGGFAFRSPRKA